jgi:hypothetical protein
MGNTQVVSSSLRISLHSSIYITPSSLFLIAALYVSVSRGLHLIYHIGMLVPRNPTARPWITLSIGQNYLIAQRLIPDCPAKHSRAMAVL